MRETHINNVCSSVVVAPNARSAELAQVWKRWALWLVEHRELLDRWAVQVDQVAFALTMEELGEDVEFLPPQTNTILDIFDEISTVYAFHLTTGHIPNFPQRFNADRTLKSEGVAQGVADAIARLNCCITDAAQVISVLPSTNGHMSKFLNPDWRR